MEAQNNGRIIFDIARDTERIMAGISVVCIEHAEMRLM